MGDKSVKELRDLLAAQRHRDKELQLQLRKLAKLPSQSLNDAFASVLEERDRRLAELQREADQRLAELEETKTEADTRLKSADHRLAELNRAGAESERLRAHAENLQQLLEKSNDAVERTDVALKEITAEAKHREELLIQSTRTVEELDAALRAKSDEVSALQGQIAALGSQAPNAEDARVLSLQAQVESLRTQLDIMSQAAQERLVALESNAQAVQDLRAKLASIPQEQGA
jgi:chromosome segregation ATPase